MSSLAGRLIRMANAKTPSSQVVDLMGSLLKLPVTMRNAILSNLKKKPALADHLPSLHVFTEKGLPIIEMNWQMYRNKTLQIFILSDGRYEYDVWDIRNVSTRCNNKHTPHTKLPDEVTNTIYRRFRVL